MKSPFRRKRTAADRFRAAFDHFIPDDDDEEDEQEEYTLSGLHWLAAGLYVAAGAEVALGEKRKGYNEPNAIRWAPLVAAPIAGAAHAARALWPSHMTRVLTQIADGIAIGVGAAGLARAAYDAGSVEESEAATWQARLPSLAPLAFAAVGVLGFVLQEEEEEAGQEIEALQERASIVQRFVPQRRSKLDRIVVHV